jgi:uncharacterized membrane protein YbhN (UPF0104 family)
MLTIRQWAARGLSATVLVASCWLLFIALRSSWRDVIGMLSEESLIVPLVSSSLLYGIALGVLSYAWSYLVGTISRVRLTLRDGLSIYAIANVAKYLPGNVFHFAARQLLGHRAGQPQRAIAQATVLELALMVICSLVLIVVVGGRYLPSQLQMSTLPRLLTGRESWAAIVAIIVACGAGAIAFFHKTALLKLLGIGVRDMALPALFISLFLAGQSLLAVFLGHAIGVGRLAPTPDSFVAAAYLLAWLAGLVVPGAPGGLGVREGVLVLLFRGVTGEAFALALAVAMRFATTGGDAIFAMLGYGLSHVGRKHEAPGTRVPEPK